MNLVNLGLRFGKHRPVTCCRGALKSLQKLHLDDKRYRRHPCSSKSVTQCPENLRIMPLSIMWTQVRFAEKECKPRCLHRDIEFPSFDYYRKDAYKDPTKTTWRQGDQKPGFMYVLGAFGIACGIYCTKTVGTQFVMFMAAAADVLALAQIEVDLSKVAEGTCMSFKWRGKPLFVKSRTAHEIEVEAATNPSSLRDPATESDRVKRPEWLIVIGICTHLGCVPMAGQGDFVGGFYCPCHGSHFDNLGRARKGPAPTNLVVPPYVFTSDTHVVVG